MASSRTPPLSEPYKFSSNLFTDENGLPIKFSMRPSEERSRLRSVIEHGGGILTSKSSVDTIRLAEPGCRTLSENCYSTRYVWECAKANKLLNMQDYRSQQHESLEGSDISETDTYMHRTARVSQRKIRGRKEYNFGDDQAIIDFIVGTRRHAEVKGTALWKDMERKKVLPGRTWQSLKERFMKQIHPSISSYNLPNDQIQRFRAPFSNEKDRYSSEDNFSTDDEFTVAPLTENRISPYTAARKPKKYMRKEDIEIIKYILQDREHMNMVSGTTLWKQMSIFKVTPHTWQSMKERFLKRILPNIGSYVIPPEFEKRLQKLIELYPATARSRMIAASQESRVDDSESPSSSSCNGFPGNLVNQHDFPPASPVVNKIETSGSCVITTSHTNSTRMCGKKLVQLNSEEDKLEASKKSISSENCSIVANCELETVIVDKETHKDVKSLNTDCSQSGINLVGGLELESKESVGLNRKDCNKLLDTAEKCLKTEDVCGSNQFKMVVKDTIPHYDMPVSLCSVSNLLSTDNEMCKVPEEILSNDQTSVIVDSNSDDVNCAKCLTSQTSVEMDIALNCCAEDKNSESVNLCKSDSILKETTDDAMPTDDANSAPSSTCATVCTPPLNGISKKLEDAEAAFRSLPINGKHSRLADQRFLRIICNLAANLPEAVLEKQQLSDPADNGCAGDEDSGSEDNFGSRPRKVLKRPSCVLNSSTDGSEAEPVNRNIVPESPVSKENAVIRKNTSTKVTNLQSKRVKTNVDIIRGSKSGTCTERYSGKNSDNFPLQVAVKQEHSKMPLPEEVGRVEEPEVVVVQDKLQCEPPEVDILDTVSKTTYNPRLHALARRKNKASITNQEKKPEQAILSDNTELYVSDTEVDLNVSGMLYLLNDLSSDGINFNLEDGKKLNYMLQMFFGVQESDMHKLLVKNNFNCHSIMKKYLAENIEDDV